MLRIGICDDNASDRNRLYELCEQFFCTGRIKREYEFFHSGEEVITYCKDGRKQIDILFLDIEMDGINGLEVKDRLDDNKVVQRIIFASDYENYVWKSFGKRTLGFMVKPIYEDEVAKWLNTVMEDIMSDVLVEIKNGKDNYVVRIENIEYLHADGNYTEIFFSTAATDSKMSILVTKKLKELLSEINNADLVRVHKSFAVNVRNIFDVKDIISLRNIRQEIPIGRKYKEDIKKRYTDYVKERIRQRI